jgi:methylmalonyl-CoA/ethylmalonyl-CoA epimerase
VIQVNHIGIAVADLEAAKRLFGSGFGWPIMRERHRETGRAPVVFFGVGALELEVFEPLTADRAHRLQGSAIGRVDHIAVDVQDWDGTIAALEGTGVEFDEPRHGRLGVTRRTSAATTAGVAYQLIRSESKASR